MAKQVNAIFLHSFLNCCVRQNEPHHFVVFYEKLKNESIHCHFRPKQWTNQKPQTKPCKEKCVLIKGSRYCSPRGGHLRVFQDIRGQSQGKLVYRSCTKCCSLQLLLLKQQSQSILLQYFLSLTLWSRTVCKWLASKRFPPHQASIVLSQDHK